VAAVVMTAADLKGLHFEKDSISSEFLIDYLYVLRVRSPECECRNLSSSVDVKAIALPGTVL
jgi:hypothetical protein